jgi:hypothetical protein
MLRMNFSRLPVVVALTVLIGCGFNPTGPFEGFDGKGTRISGRFESDAAASNGVRATAAGAAGPYDGLRVYVNEKPSVSTNVSGNGTFTLTDVPLGTLTLIFENNGQVIGRIVIEGIRANQEVRITLTMSGNNHVVIVDDDRDAGSFEGTCPRGAGFWCENQHGNNPNLSAEEFEEFAAEAASMLSSVPTLNTPEEVASAVCNTGDQLQRQLATLALNLAAETLEEDTPLVDETYATVGEALDAALAVASGGGDRNRIKDVLERINENRNTETDCNRERDDHDDDNDDDRDDDDPPTGSGCSGLDIPRGQLPPPGECKIWDPRLPAGQQGPPGKCDTLRRNMPPGTCLIDHDGRVVG